MALLCTAKQRLTYEHESHQILYTRRFLCWLILSYWPFLRISTGVKTLSTDYLSQLSWLTGLPSTGIKETNCDIFCGGRIYLLLRGTCITNPELGGKASIHKHSLKEEGGIFSVLYVLQRWVKNPKHIKRGSYLRQISIFDHHTYTGESGWDLAEPY